MKTTNIELKQFDLFIDGKMLPSKSGRYFDAVDPAGGEVFARVACADVEDMTKAISAARKAFDDGRWSGLTSKGRGDCLVKIAKLIRTHAKELADLETSDTGKTTKQTTFIDVPTSADTFEYFGKLADPLEAQSNHVSAPVKSVIRREPMGVVGCIIPWNYPLIMAAWKMAPALMAGNTIVFKPSPLACVSIMRLAQIMMEAGLPDGVVNIVPTTDNTAAIGLVKSPDVDMVSFTGGSQTGRDIMRLAAETNKKVTLELGGKSPNIVFGDCDIEAAIGGTMSAIFMNQGQMCTAGSRLLLEDTIYDRFVDELVKRTQNFKIGSSHDYASDFGPLISGEHRDRILEFIVRGQKEGAKLACGGKVPADSALAGGFYLEPAIFTNVTNDMAIARDEIFGPVLSIIKFSGENNAVRIANDSVYGLAAMIWSKDLEKADRVGRELQCGVVWINTYGGFYNEAPFGGCKQSGFGRELGRDGLLEYTRTKHICADATPGGRSLVTSWF